MCHQAMFSLCMVESEADEVTLQGVTSVGLKHALDFAYTGQVSLSNVYHSWKETAKGIAYGYLNSPSACAFHSVSSGGHSWEVLFKNTGAKTTGTRGGGRT